MKIDLPHTPPELVISPVESSLLTLLASEKALRVFGRGWALRAEAWAQIEIGNGSLYRLAKEYRTSRQNVSRIAKRVRRICEATPRS